jgi:plasmid stability protein/bifunctional DNA-binding transcriptional regulator/antitoxin component of YhaV-PrlF toxin-antitoxin module
MATLTVKNLPDALYARLKSRADAQRRSINAEAIVCLERVLSDDDPKPESRLEPAARARDSHMRIAESSAHYDPSPSVAPEARESYRVSLPSQILALLPEPVRSRLTAGGSDRLIIEVDSSGRVSIAPALPTIDELFMSVPALGIDPDRAIEEAKADRADRLVEGLREG